MEKARPLRQPGWVVYFCGFATSVLALYVVHVLANQGEHVMGWYANGIIPAGALLVGMGSGLGYALGSYWMNVKLSRWFIWGMVLTAVVDYVAAQYITYLDVLEKFHASATGYPFTQYITDICENMSFSRSGSDEAGSALGAWGYLFKVLEMAGYAGGAIIPSTILIAMPYCKSCQFYLKGKHTRFISAPMSVSEWKKFPKGERPAVVEQQLQGVVQQAYQFLERTAHASYSDTEQALQSAQPAAQSGSLGWVQILLKKCPNCDAHHLDLTLVNRTLPGNKQHAPLTKIDKTTVPIPA